MTTAITLQDITICQVVEQQGPFFDVMEFFPTLTEDLLEVNRSWLQPTFIDPVSGPPGAVRAELHHKDPAP
jgi:hypothetical protein